MGSVGEIVTVVVWGALKMLVAAGFGAGFGFPFVENFLFTSLGGCLGVFVFYNLSERLTELFRVRWLRQRNAALSGSTGIPRPIFTKRNRRIIRVKHVSGYWGVALLTPLVLTIPIGSILAARFFRHDRRTIPALLLSVAVQALCVTAALAGIVDQVSKVVQ